LEWSRDLTKKNIVDAIFDGENDNNRDKFLNNLGLLVVGYDNINNKYICILLYPFLFKAYKAYQMTMDLQSNEENIFVEGDPNYTKKGGGENCIEEGCTCIEFFPKEDNNKICNTCGHSILQHYKKERIKSKILTLAAETTRMKNKLDFLLQLYKNKFAELNNLDAFKFFKIPFESVKKWEPMLIKSFSQYKQYYNEPNPANNMKYKDMKKFIVQAHGGTVSINPNINLLPNEIVIMSCNILETVNSNRIYDLVNEFISPLNNDLIHLDNIELLFNMKEPRHRKDAFTYEYEGKVQYGNRNSFCIYTKKCPNLDLSFYDYGSKFSNNIPFFTYETPIIYSATTIREFLTKLNLNSRIASTSPEILELPLNVDTDISSPNMLKYLFNDITYSLSSMPVKSQLNEYIPRINELVSGLYNQKRLSTDRRAIQTYYDHIDFTKKSKGSLHSEILDMRRYWQSLPEDKWGENNPKKYVIYFVEACRS
jgi:hypothetical protein